MGAVPLWPHRRAAAAAVESWSHGSSGGGGSGGGGSGPAAASQHPCAVHAPSARTVALRARTTASKHEPVLHASSRSSSATSLLRRLG